MEVTQELNAADFLAHIAWSSSQRVTSSTGKSKACDFWNRILPRALRMVGSMDDLRDIAQALIRKLRCRHVLSVDHGDGITFGLPRLMEDLKTMSAEQEQAIVHEIRTRPDLLVINTAEIIRQIRALKEEGEDL